MPLPTGARGRSLDARLAVVQQQQQVREGRLVVEEELAYAIREPEGRQLMQPIQRQLQRPAALQPTILLAMAIEIEGAPPDEGRNQIQSGAIKT